MYIPNTFRNFKFRLGESSPEETCDSLMEKWSYENREYL